MVKQFGDRDGCGASVNRFRVVHDLPVLDMGCEQTGDTEDAFWLVQSGSRYLIILSQYRKS